LKTSAATDGRQKNGPQAEKLGPMRLSKKRRAIAPRDKHRTRAEIIAFRISQAGSSRILEHATHLDSNR
jgi:hypothetical protein